MALPSAPTDPSAARPVALETILLGGVTVAVLDISNAITFWALYRHLPPSRILQSVASGLLGKDAFIGGSPAAALGAGLHTFIAFGVATAFYLGCRFLPVLWRRPWVYGPLYGLAVYAVMNFVVIPLSRVPPRPFNLFTWGRFDDIVGHALLIGLPVALIARWSARRHANPVRPDTGPSA